MNRNSEQIPDSQDNRHGIEKPAKPRRRASVRRHHPVRGSARHRGNPGETTESGCPAELRGRKQLNSNGADGANASHQDARNYRPASRGPANCGDHFRSALRGGFTQTCRNRRVRPRCGGRWVIRLDSIDRRAPNRCQAATRPHAPRGVAAGACGCATKARPSTSTPPGGARRRPEAPGGARRRDVDANTKAASAVVLW